MSHDKKSNKEKFLSFLVAVLGINLLGSISLIALRQSRLFDELLFEQITYLGILLCATCIAYLYLKRKLNERNILVLLLAVIIFITLNSYTLVNVDRSRSFYILSWVSHNEVDCASEVVSLNSVQSQEAKNINGIDQRIKEQISRGLIKKIDRKCELTSLGYIYLDVAKILANIFNLSNWYTNAK